MNSMALRRHTSIHLVLILSFAFSFFVIPAPAKAGFLDKAWKFVAPAVQLSGRIAGAVIGATMASAFVPPLGMLAGGVAGWIAGGVVSDYATKSLTKLAVVGCGVAGAIALGPSICGILGGFLVGGLLGKIAVGLIKKADQKLTGGKIINGAEAPLPPAPLNTRAEVNAATNGVTNAAGTAAGTVKTGVSGVVQKVEAAGDNAMRFAKEKYEKATKAYMDAVQKAEDSTVVLKAKAAMDDAKAAWNKMLKK